MPARALLADRLRSVSSDVALGRQSRHASILVPPAWFVLAALLFVACAMPMDADAAPPTSGRAVSGVVVQFDDGTHRNRRTNPQSPPTTSQRDTSPTSAPPTQPHTSADWPRPILGVNLESIRDYERQFMFIDAIKSSAQVGLAAKPYDQQGPMGDDGWPSGDAGHWS
jgi:hypothetical protein